MKKDALGEKAIFNTARQINPGDAREDYLRQACKGDDAMIARVRSLLDAYEQQESFLESPVGDYHSESVTAFLPVAEKPGDIIGPYKLLQQIGEGGMGVVYMADQTEPLERRVALKIVKPGMDTRQVIARFEAERQALAMMDHPNIAKVLDAGVTASGRPYFVMELVKGVPITEYCDEHHLTPRERLELFVPICQAIQHAHQKGIIHRDIKPSNVLVAAYDDYPVPKVIDFGVAKAIDHRLTEKTMFTEYGQVLGTFDYMSPEQAKLNQWDVDTRTDIYSLGVLLYELLAGEVPFDRQRLRSAAIDELLRIIREEDPPRPSTRLSTSHSLPTIAANRKTDPRKLSLLVRGELDWIVMKALEKDRTRRYDTASKFAEDVEHYLNNETVEACPPSGGYRLRKFVRRNKPVIGTLAAVTAALVIGASLAIWQAIEADGERDRAVLAEQAAESEARRANEEAARADREATRAVAEANLAQRQLERAEEVKDLIEEMLKSAAPEVTLGADPTVLIKILDETAERLEAGEVKDELVAAELRWTIGRVYSDLGRQQEALEHFQHALETYLALKPHQIDTANVMGQMGNVYRRITKYEEAEQLLDKALHLSRELNDKSIDTANLMGDLATTRWSLGKYQDAEKMYLDALDVLNEHTQKGLPPSFQRNHLNNLGGLYLDMGQHRKAKQRLEESLNAMADLDPRHPERLGTLMNLALAVEALGDLDEAERIQKEVQDGYKEVLGELDPAYLAAKHNLATQYQRRAERTSDAELLKRAKHMYQEIVDVGDATGNLPNSMYSVPNATVNLAGIMCEEGEFSEAANLLENLIDEMTGSGDPMVHTYRVGLAEIYVQWGEATSEQELLEKARIICEDVLELTSGEEAIDLPAEARSAAKQSLANVFAIQGENEKALGLYQEITKELLGENSDALASQGTNPALIAAKYQSAWLHHQRDEFAEAAKLYRQLVVEMEDNPAINAEWRLGTNANLGYVLLQQGKYEEARSVLEICLARMRTELPEGHVFTENAIRWMAATYENLELHNKARQHYAEALNKQLARFEDTDYAPTVLCLADQLIDHQYEQLRDRQRGLEWARRACELARDQQSEDLHVYLATLARAQHLTSNTADAVATQKEAIEHLPALQIADRLKFEERLAEYETALRAGTKTVPDD